MPIAIQSFLVMMESQEDFVRLVYGYDLLFFVGETRPATFTVVPQPSLCEPAFTAI